MAELQRIEQFRKMANDDPNNELAHFSLGKEYLNGGMFHEAIASFKRTLELNPNLSKVYSLLGNALLKVNQKDDAIQQLTTGIGVADARGDKMVWNEIAEMLKAQGAPVPEKKTVERKIEVGEGQIQCSRCGLVKPKMARPPFSSGQGQLIWANVCAECWKEWIPMGTKVINEMRLALSDPQATKIYDAHMLEFLNLKP